MQHFFAKARQFIFSAEEPIVPRVLRREEFATRIAPFALPVLAGFLLLFISSDPRQVPQLSVNFVAGSVAAAVLFAIALFAVSWQHVPRSAEVVPPLALIFLIHLMRQNSPEPYQVFSPLVLLPLFWISLYGTRLQLLFGLSFAVVLGIISSATRTADGTALRFQLLALIVAPIICFTTQSLVRRVRLQAMQLETLVCTDSLTETPNRRAWDDELARAMARAKRYKENLCVAMLDLDHFKAYNDTYGHQSGDSFLKGAAVEWKKSLRVSDFLARYGGEEFAIILPSCPLHEAVAVLERLRKTTPGNQTCSVGVAQWQANESAWSLVERADEALYAAKNGGRDRIEVAKERPSSAAAQERPEAQLSREGEGNAYFPARVDPLENPT